MFSVIVTFIVCYIIGWVIGFIDGLTGGKLRWVIPASVVALFIYLVAKLGFLLGVVVFFALVALLVRFVWNTIKGAIYGVMSIFTGRF